MTARNSAVFGAEYVCCGSICIGGPGKIAHILEVGKILVDHMIPLRAWSLGAARSGCATICCIDDPGSLAATIP
jgi:hypothetical protein